MRQDKLSRSSILLYCAGLIPVIWLALLIAPAFGGGLPELIENLAEIFKSPFHIVIIGFSTNHQRNHFINSLLANSKLFAMGDPFKAFTDKFFLIPKCCFLLNRHIHPPTKTGLRDAPTTPF